MSLVKKEKKSEISVDLKTRALLCHALKRPDRVMVIESQIFFVSLVYRQVNKETKLDARSSVSNNWLALNSNSNLTLLSCNYTMGNKRQTSNRPKIIQRSTAIPLHFFFYFTPLPPPLSSSVCLQVTMD